MPLSITVTRSWNFPAGRPVTLAALRLGALPGVSIAGSVNGGDIADGAITPPKVAPGAYFYGVLAGTNVYSVNLNPAMTAYVDGVELLAKIGASNTAAVPATLEVDGLGAKPIYHRNGQPVKAGDLVANDIVRFRFNTSRIPPTPAGGWDIMEVLPSATIRPAVNLTEGSASLQTLVNVPPLTGYQVGQLLLVKVGTATPSLTNTGPLALNCDGIGSRSVLLPGGVALPSGIWQEGRTYLLYDNGTSFVLLTVEEPSAIVGTARNLVIQSMTTAIISVSADEVILKHGGSGRPLLVRNPNFTVDVGSGVSPNGLESGAVRNLNRWYYLWMIHNGTDPGGVLEDAGAGFALPNGPDLSNAVFAGFSYMALVGVVRLNGTGLGEVVPFAQYGRQVCIAETNIFTTRAPTGVNAYQVLVDGTPVAATDLTTFRAAVPPIAVSCRGTAGSSTATAAAMTIAACTGSGLLDANPIGAVSCIGAQVSSVANGFFAASMFEVPVRGSANYNIQWKSANNVANRLNICGYTI